jgi:hypothetical protein
MRSFPNQIATLSPTFLSNIYFFSPAWSELIGKNGGSSTAATKEKLMGLANYAAYIL